MPKILQAALSTIRYPAVKALLCVLATYCSWNRDGWGRPGVATLAKKLGRSERAVQYAIDRAVSLGYLKVQRRTNKTSLYWICWEKFSPAIVQKPSPGFKSPVPVCEFPAQKLVPSEGIAAGELRSGGAGLGNSLDTVPALRDSGAGSPETGTGKPGNRECNQAAEQPTVSASTTIRKTVQSHRELRAKLYTLPNLLRAMDMEGLSPACIVAAIAVVMSRRSRRAENAPIHSLCYFLAEARVQAKRVNDMICQRPLFHEPPWQEKYSDGTLTPADIAALGPVDRAAFEYLEEKRRRAAGWAEGLV